jgi:uncharacterized protein YpmS
MKSSSSKKEKKQNCSFWAVIISLVVVFALLLSAIVFIRIKNGFINIGKLKKTDTVSISLDQNLKNQLDNQKGETEVTLSLSEADLTSAINANDKNFPLKNPKITISKDQILLTGKSSDSVLSFKLSISLIPRVENGKVILDIKEIKTGGVSAPKLVVDQVSSGLKNYLSQFTPLENDVNIEKVSLSTGYLSVTGKRK